MDGDEFPERSHLAEAVVGRAGLSFPPATCLPTVRQSKVRDRRGTESEFVSPEGMRVSMPFHGLHKEFLGRPPIPALGHEGFRGVTFLSHGTMGGAVDLYEGGVEVSAPAGRGPQARAPVPPDLGGDYPARSAPPDLQGFMADLDAPPLQRPSTLRRESVSRT